MAETEGQHKLRTVALLGIIVGIPLIPTGIGAPMIGVSAAALLLSTEVTRSSLSAGRGAVREEVRRAAEHVRSVAAQAMKPQADETPESPRWWGRKVLQGTAGTVRGIRSLRRAMRRRQPGEPAAIGQKPAGPLRRIRSAIRNGGRQGMGRTRQRLRQHRERLRREGWRCILPIAAGGLALPGLRGARNAWGRRPWRRQPQQPAPLGPIALGPLPALPPAGVTPQAGPQDREPAAAPVPGRLAPGRTAGDPRDRPPVHPGYGKSVAPWLAPAAIDNDQPAAIGGSVPNLPATRGKYAPGARPGGALPTSGNSANHSGWMLLMERIELAVQQARRQYEGSAAELAKVNPGRTHYAETMSYLGATEDTVRQVRAHIEAVDKLEGPIRSATDGVGGPAERADSSYHSVS
jgi:hypothetical protein